MDDEAGCFDPAGESRSGEGGWSKRCKVHVQGSGCMGECVVKSQLGGRSMEKDRRRARVCRCGSFADGALPRRGRVVCLLLESSCFSGRVQASKSAGRSE
nr:hypothetical protein CFP56_71620 [Quercus suber]